MDDYIESTSIGDWVLRVSEPEGKGPYPVYLLLHGWTGDEKSMWIFSSRLPSNIIMIAPRGIYKASLGGYGWYPQEKRNGLPAQTGDWPEINEFRTAIDKLLDLLNRDNFPTGDFNNLHLVGFSQGAALTYALALSHPDKLVNFACLSGFMPEGVQDLVTSRPLEGRLAYVTHGTQDDLVPITKAREAVDLLGAAGAEVTYCEDDVGHKLSTTCFRSMQKFFSLK